jgi:hypothetical protein
MIGSYLPMGVLRGFCNNARGSVKQYLQPYSYCRFPVVRKLNLLMGLCCWTAIVSFSVFEGSAQCNLAKIDVKL